MGGVGWSVTTVRSAGVSLCCYDAERGEPVVVLLHGLAGHAGEWELTAEALAGDVRIIAFDQRGHGRSTRRPEDTAPEAFVTDVVAVINQLAGGGPVALVGQSMGAHIAMLVAAHHPDLVERLVMVEGGVGGGGQDMVDRVAGSLSAWPVPFAHHAEALSYFGGDTPRGRAWVGGLEAHPDGLWPCFDAEVMIAALGAVEATARWHEWTSISQPTLLVVGGAASAGSDEIAQMSRLRPGPGVVIIPGAGHDLHLEQTDVWVTTLRRFLRSSTVSRREIGDPGPDCGATP